MARDRPADGAAHGRPRQPWRAHGRDDGWHQRTKRGGISRHRRLSAEALTGAARSRALPRSEPAFRRSVPPGVQPVPRPAGSEAPHGSGMAARRGPHAGKHAVDEPRRELEARPRRAAAAARRDQRLPEKVREALMRAEPLRRRLFMLAAACIAPLAAMAGVALLALAREQTAQAERAGIEVTRALGTAIDAELRRSISALQAVSVSPSLDQNDLQRFHQAMRRVHEGGSWVTLTLADASGQQLANAVCPCGTGLAP